MARSLDGARQCDAGVHALCTAVTSCFLPQQKFPENRYLQLQVVEKKNAFRNNAIDYAGD